MEIAKKTSVSSTASLAVSQTVMKDASVDAANRISAGLYSDKDASIEVSLEQELRTGLGLLLKHRGGPGFGHGRLQGTELDILEARLRSISRKLVSEAAVEQ